MSNEDQISAQGREHARAHRMPEPRRPIANIWAVGRNYADHAKELANQVPQSSENPMIFLKAGSSIVEEASFALPAFSNDIHHELEIALQFDHTLHFSHLTLALDLTARDIQEKLKQKAHPWTLAKSFRSACPIGPLLPIPTGLDLQNLRFTLKVNGRIRQSGSTRDMIFGAETLRQYVVERFPVMPGDLLLTGTPAGVARLKPGDSLEGEITDHLKTSWQVRA